MPHHGHHHQQIAEQRRGDDRAEDADFDDGRGHARPVDLRLGVIGIRVLLGRSDVQQRCHVERGNLRRAERRFRAHARPAAQSSPTSFSFPSRSIELREDDLR